MPGVCILVCVKVYMCACMCLSVKCTSPVETVQRSEDESVTSSATRLHLPQVEIKQIMVPIT